MLETFKKLMFARELSFEDGKITMLKGRLIMIPISIFVNLYRTLKEQGSDAGKILYEIGKFEGVHWIGALQNRYSMKGNDMLKWGFNSMALAGWAKFDIVKVDLEKRDYAYFRAFDSAFAETLGKTGEVCDYLLAGFFGGGGSVIYNKSLTCEEIKCTSKGDKCCEFRVVPSKEDWLPLFLQNVKKYYKI